MPISWFDVIPNVLKKIEQLKPESILDVGIGFGKYGVLMREILDLPHERFNKDTWQVKIDGVEAFKGYYNPLHKHVYNNVFYKNILDLVDTLPKYDVILLIDVLEHFDKEEGIALLESLVKISNKAIIISTPQFPDVQEDYLGNKYEEHKSRWTNVDLVGFDFTSELIKIETNSAQIFVIYPPSKKELEFPQDRTISSISKKTNTPLKIAYFLPHHHLTGGLKMLLEQMKQLRKNGHKIIALYRGEKGNKVLPSWFDLTVDQEFLVPNDESILPYINQCDIGVAGWLEQLPELAKANVPILYWEQGNEWLFGEKLSPERRAYLQYCYAQPVYIASVSPIVSKAIEVRYHRKSKVISNGIDVNFYHPTNSENENIILLVGNPHLLFKGFDIAIRTLLRVWKAGHEFKVKWVCQDNPQLNDVPFPFEIEYIVNPTQPKLAEIYRNSDIFLFTSWYEGFGMPPMEAMASGVPVVSTRCGGIDAYAKEGFNVLLSDPGDIQGLADNIIHLLDSEEEKQRLIENGRTTALEFSFPNVIKDLEEYLIQIVNDYVKR